MNLSGIWLPIITPFLNDEIDFDSYDRLLEHYISKNISGLIVLGTTGECPAVDDDEARLLVEHTVEKIGRRIPVFAGVGGNYTKHVVEKIRSLDNTGIDGYLSVVPYYNRPDQRGIYHHFKSISETTSKQIMIYNIPYRTGVNMENETVFKTTELTNIIGIKDSCGNLKQSMELIFNKPENFSVMTGEDLMFYTMLGLGGDGGVLASAHIYTEKFADIHSLMKSNNHLKAIQIWKELTGLVELLFCQPNPAPIKYVLKNKNLITDDEVRLPIMAIDKQLGGKLDQFI